ncbi:MAG: hypothetical protein EOO04_30505, partial [Chitinophagaceae bacterium]
MKNYISLLFLAGSLLWLIPVSGQSPGKPNVIIIFIDDMGFGDLSCYGNKQVNTVHIDALAKRGTRFTQFYSNSPVCSPSRVAMLTGQYPARHRFYTYLADRKKNQENKMPDFLPASVPTLAKILHASGYATAHIGKWHLGGGRDVGDAPLPTEYGFDKSYTSFEGLGDRTLHLTDNLNKQSLALGRGNITEAPQNQQTRIYVDSTISFIRANPGKPFFINFFPNEVHDPYNPIDGTEKEFSSVTTNPDQQKFLATLKEMDKQIGRLLVQWIADRISEDVTRASNLYQFLPLAQASNANQQALTSGLEEGIATIACLPPADPGPLQLFSQAVLDEAGLFSILPTLYHTCLTDGLTVVHPLAAVGLRSTNILDRINLAYIDLAELQGAFQQTNITAYYTPADAARLLSHLAAQDPAEAARWQKVPWVFDQHSQ